MDLISHIGYAKDYLRHLSNCATGATKKKFDEVNIIQKRGRPPRLADQDLRTKKFQDILQYT